MDLRFFFIICSNYTKGIRKQQIYPRLGLLFPTYRLFRGEHFTMGVISNGVARFFYFAPAVGGRQNLASGEARCYFVGSWESH
jgi:hypothetical protein